MTVSCDSTTAFRPAPKCSHLAAFDRLTPGRETSVISRLRLSSAMGSERTKLTLPMLEVLDHLFRRIGYRLGKPNRKLAGRRRLLIAGQISHERLMCRRGAVEHEVHPAP